MSRGRMLASWIPPLVVGITLATAAEVSAVLLLYSGQGFLRALSLILAVEAGALALGLWVAVGVHAPRVVEAVRRRWLFALAALTAAAVMSGVWAVLGGLSDSRLGQGLGLALLGGLPLYAAGALAGLLARPQAGLTPPTDARGPQPAVLVVVGAGLGFLATGNFLLPRLTPASVLLACIVVLSVGALVHSSFLRLRPPTKTLRERPSASGSVRVEERSSRGSEAGAKLLWAEGRLRGAEALSGRPLLGDEIWILESVERMEAPPGRILLLGYGAGTLVRALVELGSGVRVDVVEETPEVVELARECFGELDPDRAERVRILEAAPDSTEQSGAGDYDLVLIESTVLDSQRAALGLSGSQIQRFRDLLAAGGVLMIFRLPFEDRTEEQARALLASAKEWLPDAELWYSSEDVSAESALREIGLTAVGSAILVARRPRARESRGEPDGLDGGKGDLG